jgi:hypothetical protein
MATTAKTPRRTARAAPTKAAAKPAKAAKTRTPRSNGAAVAAPAARPQRGQPAAKPPKLKLVRDSFTIPRDEYAVIDALKARSAKLGRVAKKSELLRAGLKLLASCTDPGLLGALEAVPSVKTGRPKGKRKEMDSASGR